MSRKNLLWDQFRRMFLGTLVEVLLETGVRVEFQTIRIAFDPASEFRVPRLNNYMRFKGDLRASLQEAPAPAAVATLRHAMSRAWPDILQVVDIPIGDRLTSERNRIDVTIDQKDGEDILLVEFDLIAD